MNANMSGSPSSSSSSSPEAAEVGHSPTPDSWTFSGSTDIGCDTHCCCFSADSKYFITGGGHRAYGIRLWNPSTRRLVTTLIGHEKAVNVVISFYLDGKVMVASGADDYTIRIWELKDPASSSLCIATMKARDHVYSLAFCSKQNVLMSGQYSSTIKFWCASDWQYMQTVRASDSVHALSLSSDESKLASGHQDGSIHIWNMDSPSRPKIKVWEEPGRFITVHGLCFSPSQSDVLAAATYDGANVTWNWITECQIGTVSSQAESVYSPCVFSKHGEYYVTVSRSNQLILVDTATSTVIKPMDGSPSAKHISSACFSPDGKYLACATRDDATSFFMWESQQ